MKDYHAEIKRYEAQYANVDTDAAKRKQKIAAKIALLRKRMAEEGLKAAGGIKN